MPVSKRRSRTCQYCQVEYTLGQESTLHKYCSLSCRRKWHYNKWKSSGGFRSKSKARAYILKCKYNITPTEYNKLLENQNNSCAICCITEPSGYNWHVDHCHKTQKIRGILCSKCNQGLGLFNDNIKAIRKAADYLENSTNDG